MNNPSPVNLKTPEEVKAQGWAAEARDAEGHLIATQGWLDCYDGHENAKMMAEFIADYSTDCRITIFPENIHGGQ